MQKTFCNLCGKELTQGMLAGGMMRSVERYPVSPIKGLLGDPSGASVQKQVVQDVWDLCDDCITYVWKAIELKQKELRDAEEKIVLAN